MGELYLVRHGQANSGATTEKDYDRLSTLAMPRPDCWAPGCATMRPRSIRFWQARCAATAKRPKGWGSTPERFDDRLNEMEYFALARDMEVHHGIAPPASSEDFATHMPQTLAAWEQATINGSEPFGSFETRILGAIAEATKPGKRVLCVTSGGVISMVMRGALDLSTDQMAHVLLPIYNSSLHRFSHPPRRDVLDDVQRHPAS